jgi:hypothetical protein
LTQDEIPPALLAKDPELAAVGEALEQIRDGKAVTARCVKCGKQLLVEGVAATGTLVIRARGTSRRDSRCWCASEAENMGGATRIWLVAGSMKRSMNQGWNV